MSNARVTQQTVQTIAQGVSNARVTQQTVQTIAQGVSNARVTQQTVQIIVLVADIIGSAGIPSGEVFGAGGALIAEGTPLDITGISGIVSGEIFSVGYVSNDQEIVSFAGIVSGEAFGIGDFITLLEGVNGIVSEETFGIGDITGPVIGVAGIASHLAFGITGGNVSSDTLTSETGIPSEEAFGAGGTLGSIGGPLTGFEGIISGETFEIGIIAGPISGNTGITSEETFGFSGSVSYRIIGVWGTGIESAEFFPTTGRLFRGIGGTFGIFSGEAFGTTGTVLSLDTDESNFSIFIGGQIRTVYLKAGSIRGDRQLNFQGAVSFELVDESGTYTPQIGEEVLIYHYDESIPPERVGSNKWSRCFAGTIDSIELQKTYVSDLPKFYRINCSDYGKALSRRIINEKYPQVNFGTLKSIMNDLSAKFLLAEGIQYVHRGDPGVTIPDIEFSYTPLSEAIDRIAELVGWERALDWYKNLYIYDRPAQIMSAPFDITEETAAPNGFLWSNLRISKNRGLYRNRQFMKTSFSQTSRTITKTYICPILYSPGGVYWELHQYIQGDPTSARAAFLIDYSLSNKVSRVLSMKLNGIVQEFYTGVGGSFGAEVFNTPPAVWRWKHIWGWDAQFIYNVTGYPYTVYPKAGDVLEITYEILNDLPAPVVEENVSEIVARRAIEGGTGYYDAVEELHDINDRDLVIEYARSLLAKFGVMGLEVDIETYRFGLEPGQEITVNLPSYGLNSQVMTIESVSFQEEYKRLFRNSVKVSNQIQQRDALTAFHRLVKRLRKPGKQTVGIVTWDLAMTYPGIMNPGLSTGNSLGNAVFLRRDTTLDNVLVYFKTAPTGAAIRIRIKANGISIFPSPGYIEYPIAQTTAITFVQFMNAPLTLTKGTKLEIDILQAGSEQPGKDGTVHLMGWT